MDKDVIGKNALEKMRDAPVLRGASFPRTPRAAEKALTNRYELSVIAGDLQMLDGRWYVTQAGLLANC